MMYLFVFHQDLATMVKSLLISFYRVNNSKPVRIVFFRDGVSEGQFREVLRYEVTIRSFTPRVRTRSLLVVAVLVVGGSGGGGSSSRSLMLY